MAATNVVLCGDVSEFVLSISPVDVKKWWVPPKFWSQNLLGDLYLQTVYL